MLYRPTEPAPISLVARLGQFLDSVRATHRQRLALLDLRAMSPHLKRDLGLDGSAGHLHP
jgi:hypothetical protein